jgi:hypothetical protein
LQKEEPKKAEEKKSPVAVLQKEEPKKVEEMKKIDEIKQEVKKLEEKKVAEVPKPPVTKESTKAVAPLPPSSVSAIDAGVSAVAVGAGVGVAALGVFAALVAAQDQGSADKTASDASAVTEETKKALSAGSNKPAEASVKQGKTDSTVQKPAPYIDTKPVSQEKAGAISNGKSEMGPLVEERKKQPPKPMQQSPQSMGAMSYIDALSSNQSAKTMNSNSKPPPKNFSPSAKSKKTVSAPGGGSYLDSL